MPHDEDIERMRKSAQEEAENLIREIEKNEVKDDYLEEELLFAKRLLPKQEKILIELARKRSQTAYDLAKNFMLGMRYSHIQQILNKLQKRKLIITDMETIFERTGQKKKAYRLTSKGIEYVIILNNKDRMPYELQCLFNGYRDLFPLFSKWNALWLDKLDEEALAGYLQSIHRAHSWHFHPITNSKEWAFEFLLGGLFHKRDSEPNVSSKEERHRDLIYSHHDLFRNYLEYYWQLTMVLSEDQNLNDVERKRYNIQYYYDIMLFMDLLTVLRINREVNERWLEYMKNDPEIWNPFIEKLTAISFEFNSVPKKWSNFLHQLGISLEHSP